MGLEIAINSRGLMEILGGLGVRYSSQRVRTEQRRQTHFGANSQPKIRNLLHFAWNSGPLHSGAPGLRPSCPPHCYVVLRHWH